MRTMVLPRIPTLRIASSPVSGSTTRPPSITTSYRAAGRGFAHAVVKQVSALTATNAASFRRAGNSESPLTRNKYEPSGLPAHCSLAATRRYCLAVEDVGSIETHRKSHKCKQSVIRRFWTDGCFRPISHLRAQHRQWESLSVQDRRNFPTWNRRWAKADLMLLRKHSAKKDWGAAAHYIVSGEYWDTPLPVLDRVD
jgi:hypothetical protein